MIGYALIINNTFVENLTNSAVQIADACSNIKIYNNILMSNGNGDDYGDASPPPGVTPGTDCDDGDSEVAMLTWYRDSDGDGWGDPCDNQPTRADSYPGAPELCDARDNDGTVAFALDELADEDFDGYTDVRLDMEDREGVAEVFRKHQPQRVVNLAAQAGVRYSLINPHAYVDTNLVGFAFVTRRNQLCHRPEQLSHSGSRLVNEGCVLRPVDLAEVQGRGRRRG